MNECITKQIHKYSGEQEKDPLLCEGRIEKSVPCNHRLLHSASLVMPNGDPRDEFFYPTLTLMIDTYINHGVEKTVYKDQTRFFFIIICFLSCPSSCVVYSC